MPNQKETPSGRNDDVRMPYEPPAVVSDDVFETLALTCGKSSGAFCATNGGFAS